MSKSVVITGTASGFGLASVRRFAAEGWRIVATVRKTQDLDVHRDLPNVTTLLLDVDDEQADLEFGDRAVAELGHVDALINNAGHYQMGPLEATTMEQIRQQYQTNVFGLMAVTKSFIPYLRKQGSGVIVNLSSISAEQGYPYTSVYAASKAAVAALSEGLNIELAPFGVAVKAILPGAHATRIFTKMDAAQGVPEAYEKPMNRFFARAAATGSEPEVTADVIYRAVTDGLDATVRYYSGPDGEAIPRAKALLGPEWYWREFRSSVIDEPSALWASLMSPAGDAPLEMAR